MLRNIALGTGVALLSATSLLADFQYQQTTKITGGAIAGLLRFAGAFKKSVNEPVTTNVYVKGNRMASLSNRNGSIIDLDSETITEIDFEKKTYSVVTFAQMKQALEDAMARAKQRSKDHDQNVEMNVKASVKETGKSKAINGLNANEYILALILEGKDQKSGETGGFGVTSDMWMAPDINGYDEVRNFERRLAEKLGMMFNGGVLDRAQMLQPELAKGFVAAAKEMSKLKGVPVMQVMRMGAAQNGQPIPAASEAPEEAKSQGPSASEAASGAAEDAAAGAIGRKLGKLGGLGGFGGFGRKKKQAEEPPAEAHPQGGEQGAAILMEATTESSGFSSAPVEASKFEPPAGFKQVESEMVKRARR
jgi:hypothetical protein